MLYPSSVRLLGISVFGLPSSAQTTFISSVRGILPGGLRLSSTSGLWSWESAKARPLACMGRTPYSSPGELSMWEAEAFIGRLVDFGGPQLMATGGGTPQARGIAAPALSYCLAQRRTGHRRLGGSRGVGGRERRPAAAVTEAGAALRQRTVRPVLFHSYAHRLYLGMGATHTEVGRVTA
jgi:hypothetical protein